MNESLPNIGELRKFAKFSIRLRKLRNLLSCYEIDVQYSLIMHQEMRTKEQKKNYVYSRYLLLPSEEGNIA